MGNNPCQHTPHQPFTPWPTDLFGHFSAANIQQMRIINTRRTGRGTRQTSQTSIQMKPGIRRHAFRIFQQFPHHPYPATRAVPFITGQHECRTGSGTESTMHTCPQDAISPGNRRIIKLFSGKMRLHNAVSLKRPKAHYPKSHDACARGSISPLGQMPP